MFIDTLVETIIMRRWTTPQPCVDFSFMSTHALDYLPRVSNTGRAYHGWLLASFQLLWLGSGDALWEEVSLCSARVSTADGSKYELDIMYAPESPRIRDNCIIVCPDHPRVDVIYDTIGGAQ